MCCSGRRRRCGPYARGRRKSTITIPIDPININAAMVAPRWAELERKLLDDNAVACREFYKKYFDDRGYLLCFARWGANDGPDDAPENFNRWPELHALGGHDDLNRLRLRTG